MMTSEWIKLAKHCAEASQEMESQKFKANPVEYLIFGTVATVFVVTAYRFYSDSQNIRLTAMTPMRGNPVSEAREPASALLERVEMTCGTTLDRQTGANHVLIQGPICGNPGIEGKDLLRASATNSTKGTQSPVITDLEPNRFRTDVPLALGRNSIRVEFSFKDGKTETFDLNIIRN